MWLKLHIKLFIILRFYFFSNFLQLLIIIFLSLSIIDQLFTYTYKL